MKRVSHALATTVFTIAVSTLTIISMVDPSLADAQAPDASPPASPDTTILPEGPLGQQIQWLLDSLNTPADSSSADPIEKHVSSDFLATMPADKLAEDFLKLNADLGPFTIKDHSLITTMDLPATHASFVLVGKDGTEVRTSLTIDRESGLISGLTFETESGATPMASPVTAIDLPQGALGDQIQWVIDTINSGAGTTSAEQITQHVGSDFLAQVPAGQLIALFGQLHAQEGAVTIETDSLVTSRDMPPTNARFILVGEKGVRLTTSIAIDRESEKLTGLLFQPAEPASKASPIASPIANSAFTDADITFQSGGDTIYGSFMHATTANTKGAAALIISGSGATDRNGNNTQLTSMNTNLNLANTLASNGIASLRYDKLGSGKTGIGTHVDGKGVDYNLFLKEAQDAAAFLLSQADVDPAKLILVGHSEGALFALVLAQQMTAAGTPPAAVILVSPLSIRYLDILTEQLTPQFDQAVASGQMTREQGDAGKKEVAAIVKSLRETGTLPSGTIPPELQALFNPGSAAFLAQIDKVDPGEIARQLPAALPVLVLHGEKDQQVTATQVAHLMSGFEQAGNKNATLVELPNANHLLKVIAGKPNAAADYANPNLPFSPDAVKAIDAFLHDHSLANESAGS